MTNKDKHLRVIVVDRSGSMQSIQGDMTGGLQAYIKEQAALPGETLFTLVQFDSEIENVAIDRDAAYLTDYTLVPRGMTALNDAIAHTINLVGEHLRLTPEDERPGDVVVLIITDGYENHSKKYPGEEGRAQVRQMVEHQTDKYSWKFTYLGANQDAVLVGRELGISPESSLTYDTSATVDSLAVASAMVTRGTVSGVYAYSGEERTTASGLNP